MVNVATDGGRTVGSLGKQGQGNNNQNNQRAQATSDGARLVVSMSVLSRSTAS